VTRFLSTERQTLDDLLAGLDRRLADTPLATLEGPNSPGLDAFKEAGGPALLVPEEYAGIGADPVQAVRVQRAIGARSPSLAVATTMHHFSVAGLVEACAHSSGLEWMLLESIARQRLLLASGFAEGHTGQSILQPTMTGRERDGAIVLNGSKKPCSLSRSMDLLTASVAVAGADGEQLAIALVPKGTAGLSVKPFWNTFALAGAESDEVVLEEVEVPEDLVVRTDSTPGKPLDDLQTTGFLWFELLVTASYLGAVSGLVERVLTADKADAATRAELIVEVEASMAGIESVARDMTLGHAGEPAFARALVCRYAAQDAIGRAARTSVESLGGMAFIGSEDVGYLAAACHALAYHPPPRARMAEPLCDYYAGGPLRTA
jgi:alkylation response protein AidB-like acyl-CoA dehydrogenase